VTLRGPYEEKYYVEPKRITGAFFQRRAGKRRRGAATTRVSWWKFCGQAFRRQPTANSQPLGDLAEGIYTQPRQTFETGVAQAMVRCWHRRDFFSAKKWLNQTAPEQSALVDEYSLASRLSYFLWSSMPDDELIRWPAKEHFAKISVRR